jgi:hypothetical protein
LWYVAASFVLDISNQIILKQQFIRYFSGEDKKWMMISFLKKE